MSNDVTCKNECYMKVDTRYYSLALKLLCDDTWRELIQTKVYKDNVIAFAVDEAHLVKW